MDNHIKCNSKKGPIILVSRAINYTFPLSYAYLAGYLKEKGEEVIVLFKPQNADYTSLINKIIKLKPLLVGLGNLYTELQEISEIITLLENAGRKFPIVIGGQMVSPLPEFALECTKADFAVIGEGEIILYDLVKALRNDSDISKIKGLGIRQNDKVYFTGKGEYINDLSNLPAIPYELFPTAEWLPVGRWYVEYNPQPHWRFNDRVINVHGGRGCPFNCNFCYHHSKARYRPIENMISEAIETLNLFNGNMLYFSDDLVLATPKRARQLVDAINKIGKPIEYSVSARIDCLARIDDDLLLDMKKIRLQDNGNWHRIRF